MSRHLLHLHFFTKRPSRGSVMILSLLLTGVLAIGIAAMLSSVQHLNRSARDKLAMEDAYQSAMAGLHMGRAWLADPASAGDMLASAGGDPENKLNTLLVSAKAMSEAVLRAGVEHNDPSLAMLQPDEIVEDYFPGAENTPLADGRRVIYTFPSSDNGRIMSFFTDTENEPSESLTDAPTTGSIGSFVSRLRITTPYAPATTGTYPAESPWNGQPWMGAEEGLRRVSLILEAEGTAVSGARAVTRVVQQKLLVFPDIPPGVNNPLPNNGTKFGQAIIAGSNVTVTGSSSLKIHWGTVLTKGDTELIKVPALDVAARKLSSDSKFYGAGVTDSWVKYQASGRLYGVQGEGGNRWPLLPSTIPNSDTGAPVPVTDLFSQARNNEFGEAWRVTPDLAQGVEDHVFSLDETYYRAGTPEEISITDYRDMTDPTNTETTEPPALYTMDGEQALQGDGALVQNWPAVEAKVDYILNQQMDYGYWKQRAIAEGIYIRPKASGNGFVNEGGAPLYVAPDGDVTSDPPPGSTALTDLKQLSMKGFVPESGETEDIADKILFIDTPQGVKNGTQNTYTLGSKDAFFWKGMMYVNGNFETKGGGAFPTVIGRDPNQWVAKNLAGSDELGSTPIENCFIRGVIMATGTYARTGNAAVYGTMIAKGGYNGSGSPDVYYDQRNGAVGLFADPVTPVTGGPPSTYQITGGPLTELGGWPETGS